MILRLTTLDSDQQITTTITKSREDYRPKQLDSMNTLRQTAGRWQEV